MGIEIIAATSTAKSGGNYYLLIGIVVLFGLLYFVTIRPQRNRQRAAVQTQREIVPGVQVRTTAGMYATVVAVEDQDVVLEIAPGVEVRFLRRAIMDVVPDPSEMGVSDPVDYQTEDAPETLNEAEDDAATGG